MDRPGSFDSDAATSAPATSWGSFTQAAASEVAAEDGELKQQWDEEQGPAAAAATASSKKAPVKKRKRKTRSRSRSSRKWRRKLVRCARKRRWMLAWGCALLTVLTFAGFLTVIFTMVLRGIHPVVFEMTRCALVGLKFDGPNVLSLVAMEGRITSRCNYTTWTEPYYVQIFFHGLPTGPVSIGKVAYPAMVLPPFATHALNQTGEFLNVPKELAQQSMTKGGVSPMSIHMVARTRAQAFGASLPRLPAKFDMKCTYQNHWGASPTDTVCDTHLRPIWTR